MVPTRAGAWVGGYSLLYTDDCFCILSIPHVFRHISSINIRVKSNTQASRYEYKAATHSAQWCHRRKKAAAFWTCPPAVETGPVEVREIGWGNTLHRCFVELGQWAVETAFQMSLNTFEYVSQLIKPALTPKITLDRYTHLLAVNSQQPVVFPVHTCSSSRLGSGELKKCSIVVSFF